MERVTTRDGQTIELQPCPDWCTEKSHFAPDVPIHPSDGYHHYGRPVRIDTSDSANTFDGTPVTVKVYLKSWVCPVDAAPGPTKIGMDISEGGVDLSPSDARRIARVLVYFSDGIDAVASD
ncbi:MAG TPA: hypothetical protein VF069_16320 [Streptosporangiaceae bacterium]